MVDRSRPEADIAIGKSLRNPTHDWDEAHLRWLDRYLGGKQLDEISLSLVASNRRTVASGDFLTSD